MGWAASDGVFALEGAPRPEAVAEIPRARGRTGRPVAANPDPATQRSSRPTPAVKEDTTASAPVDGSEENGEAARVEGWSSCGDGGGGRDYRRLWSGQQQRGSPRETRSALEWLGKMANQRSVQRSQATARELGARLDRLDAAMVQKPVSSFSPAGVLESTRRVGRGIRSFSTRDRPAGNIAAVKVTQPFREPAAAIERYQ